MTKRKPTTLNSEKLFCRSSNRVSDSLSDVESPDLNFFSHVFVGLYGNPILEIIGIQLVMACESLERLTNSWSSEIELSV